MTARHDITIHFPVKVIFGNGRIAELKEGLTRLSTRKVLIFTIEPLLNGLHHLIDEIRASSIEVLVDTSIMQEPYFSDFEKLLEKMAPVNPDDRNLLFSGWSEDRKMDRERMRQLAGEKL